jgi:peptide/nickel transport system substrate-binding protein
VGEPHDAPQPQTDKDGDADVHAFLIADVRGYTMFTQERGDEEGAHLAARFASVVRTLVEDHRGRVIELRGDEALVVFGSPRSAIRGAVALQQRFVEETIADPSFPLTVGIGLDAGEAVPVEGGFRGAALNVAGRLCSLAKAGEVLASREIVHLARRLDGIRFTERGQAQLKGIDQPVHVVLVRSEQQDAAEAIAPFVRSTAPPPARKRWKVVAVAVAFAVLAALVAVPLIARGSSEIDPNSIGVLDAESGELTATVELAQRPGSVAASADAVWVTHPDFGTVTRIDPIDQEIRDTIQVGENPTGITVGEDAVWVVESGGPTLSRISPETNTVVGDPIEVGNGPAGVAVGEGSVWVTNRFDGTISRIDPDRGEVVKAIPVGLDPRGIAIGFGSVWVGLAGSNRIVRIDPGTNEVTQAIGVGNAPGSMAVGSGAVWVVNTLDDTVSAIDPETNSVVDTIAVGNGPAGIAVVQGTVWVANEADGTLSRIEPGDTSAGRIVIGSVPQGLVGASGALWVSVRGTATSHRGGTLRMASLYSPDSFDPGASYVVEAWRLLHLLGDGLLAFEPIGGNASLVPDLASSVPTPTDGGRTYRFQLRSGIRYSNGEVVAPADFRSALERGFPLNESAHMDLYGGLVGAEACVRDPDTCDLSQGIETDDATGTITFNLVAPDPEFLYKLTLPFAYPVPPSTPDKHQGRAGVPGTGPYMLEAPKTREGLALVRNPHFHVWSQAAQPDGYVDRLEWTFRVEPEAQVDAVAAGDLDVALDTYLATESLEDLFVRSSALVHTTPTASTWYVVLNTEAPPFDHVDVRRALNLALDRERIVQMWGGDTAALATCQQLPPNFPGYHPYCPYTMNPGPEGEGPWIAPDLAEANGIVRRSGTAGMRVVFEYESPLWAPFGAPLGDYLVELLDELGYRGSVRAVPPGELFRPGHQFQMVVRGWGADYPAASNFIVPFHTCGASFNIGSGFCDPRIDAMIDRASRLQLEDPAAAGALWAEIDRAIVDQAPYLWLFNQIYTEFVSERVGNYQSSLQWGGLLNQFWVR